MASKKKTKKSLSQQVMGVATMGMPAPVQSVASSKWGSKLLMLIVPLLIASGVITISFSGGLPSIQVNEQRAKQVGEELRQGAVRAAEQARQQDAYRYR